MLLVTSKQFLGNVFPGVAQLLQALVQGVPKGLMVLSIGGEHHHRGLRFAYPQVASRLLRSLQSYRFRFVTRVRLEDIGRLQHEGQYARVLGDKIGTKNEVEVFGVDDVESVCNTPGAPRHDMVIPVLMAVVGIVFLSNPGGNIFLATIDTVTPSAVVPGTLVPLGRYLPRTPRLHFCHSALVTSPKAG